MNTSTPRCIGNVLRVLVPTCLFLLAAPLQAARIDPRLLPLPETATPGHDWYTAQRIRYLNTPLLRKADHWLEAGAYAEAEKALEQAKVNDPSNLRIRVMLLETCGRLQKWDKVLALCDALLRDHPGYGEVRLYKAFAAYDAGRYALAVQTLEEALPLSLSDDERAEVYRRLTDALVQTRQYEQAEARGREWLERADTQETRSLLLECAVHGEKWEDADRHLQRLIELSPDREEQGRLYRKQGYLLTNLGRLEEARAAFEQAADLLAGRDVRLEMTRQLGQNAYRMEDFKQAARDLKGYLLETFDEDLATAYLNALSQSGQWERGVVEAQEFLQREGLSETFRETAQRTLLESYKQLNRNDALYEVASTLYRQFPREEYLKETAVAAQRAGRADEALGLYKQYLKDHFDESIALDYYELLKSKKSAEQAPPSDGT